jgi:hypothetical protein
MSHFEDGDHLASWAGICPAKGNRLLLATLVDCAWGVTRNKRAQFRGMYYRIKARRGSKRAVVAVAHQLLTTAYAVLASGRAYKEPCLPLLSDHHRRHKAEQLTRRLKQLGYEVTLTPKAA